MTAYYNEFDPYAAQWLRNLIQAGHIAPGVVDERSIQDVTAGDLAGFTQCHFFAGIGIWSLALRRAGWSDTRPVWTMSCPCQPFSAAGTGAGFDDERHLWPDAFHLISQCTPPVIFGEQVASKAVGPWIDLVHADLEAMEYAFGCVAFPSAGVGAPHIRDRAYWVAYATGFRERTNEFRSDCGTRVELARAEPGCHSGYNGSDVKQKPQSGPVNGKWRDADWLFCRDGKWRPVEPGPQQMVNGFAQSLGRLRAESIQETIQEIKAHVDNAKADFRETLLDVWLSLAEETLQRTSRRLVDVREAPVLLAYLRQLADEGWEVAKGLPRPSEKATERNLRMLWEQESSSRASRRRRLDEQRTKEHSDLVCVLSSVLARHAQKSWGESFARYVSDAFPLAIGEKSRTDRLRAYGNAINAEAAKEFILAYLEQPQMIYLTPYDITTLQCTGPSTDSGFTSLDEVRELMGEPDMAHPRMLTYGDSCFTDFPISLEAPPCITN